MFKQRKNKTFKPQTVFSKAPVEYTVENTDKKRDFVSKWRSNSLENRKVKGTMSIKMLVLVLVLLLICMYLLDAKFI